MSDLIQRLRKGYIVKPKRWSGDTHSDSATGEVDAEATDALMVEAADEVERLQSENRQLMEQLSDKAYRDGHYVTLQEFMEHRKQQAAEAAGGEDE